MTILEMLKQSGILTLLGMGVVFLFPVLVYFLTVIGILTPQFLKTYRRHAIVVIMVIAAIVTPPCIPIFSPDKRPAALFKHGSRYAPLPFCRIQRTKSSYKRSNRSAPCIATVANRLSPGTAQLLLCFFKHPQKPGAVEEFFTAFQQMILTRDRQIPLRIQI